MRSSSSHTSPCLLYTSCYDRRGDIFVSPIPPQDVQTLIQNAAALGRPVSVAGRTQLLSNGTDDDLTAYYAIGGRAPVISDKFDEVSRGDVFQLLMGCRESDWPAILKGLSLIHISRGEPLAYRIAFH